MTAARKIETNSSRTPRDATHVPSFKRRQRVLVSYGCVQIMRAVGQLAVSGYIHSRKHARRGWYEVDLGWDMDMQAPRLVSVHHSALTVQ